MDCLNIATLIVSIIGALAWLPHIINFTIKIISKPKGLLLNYNLLTDAKNYPADKEPSHGIIIFLRLNLYIKHIDLFCPSFSIKVTTNNATYQTEILNWNTTYITKDNGKKYYYRIDDSQDFYEDRLIKRDSSNIKCIAFFVENSSISDFKDIKKISIKLNKMRMIELTQSDLPKYGQTKKLEELEEEVKDEIIV